MSLLAALLAFVFCSDSAFVVSSAAAVVPFDRSSISPGSSWSDGAAAVLGATVDSRCGDGVVSFATDLSLAFFGDSLDEVEEADDDADDADDEREPPEDALDELRLRFPIAAAEITKNCEFFALYSVNLQLTSLKQQSEV